MRLSGTVYSKVLDMDTGITVITPNKFKSDGEHPVVYLLHGICGDSRTWRDYSMLPLYALAGDAIYVLPEAGRSFYADTRSGLRYFTYIAEELPELCKNLFHISSDRAHTAVMGASMGGYGALKCALTYPERYGACAAFSSCCLNMAAEFAELNKLGTSEALASELGEQLMHDLTAAFGKPLCCTEADNVLELIKRAKRADTLPQIYLTCGTQDPFYEDHVRFCAALDTLGVAYTFDRWEAQHDLPYFNEALHRAIERISL